MNFFGSLTVNFKAKAPQSLDVVKQLGAAHNSRLAK
jgi:hypothetical protein